MKQPNPFTRDHSGLIAAIVLVAAIIVLSACGSEPTPDPAVSISPTATATFVPGPALPVLAGTPVPQPEEPITPENVDQLVELAIWGKGQIREVAYSPDGKLLAVGTTAGIWLYDADTLTELRFINTSSWMDSLAFTPDSTKLIAGAAGGNAISIWDVKTGAQLRTLQLQDPPKDSQTTLPKIVAFSQDGQIVATTTDDEKEIVLWDIESGGRLHTLEGPERTITVMAFSPDHTLLAVGTQNETIWVWDVRSGTLLHILEGHSKRKPSLVFLSVPIGHQKESILLASSGIDGKVWLWNMQSGTPIHIVLGNSSFAVGDIAISPDGTLLAVEVSTPSSKPDTPPETTIQIWQIADEIHLQTLQGHTSAIDGLIFSPDNTKLVSGSTDGTIRRWDTTTGMQIDMLTGFERHGRLLARGGPRPAFLSANKVFLSNTYNFDIELWELSTGRLIDTLNGHTSEVTNLVISTDGLTLASVELWDYSLWTWETETGRSANTFEAYIDVGYGKSLDVSSDGSQVANGDSRGGGRVYSPETGEQLYAIHSGQRGVSNLTFSPDGYRLAVLSGEFTLTLWDAKTGEVVRTIETGPQGGGIAFTPDGELLAVGTRERSIQLWDVATGELIDTLPGDTLPGDGRQIQSLAFSPDGTLLVAGIRDVRTPIGSLTPTIQLWDMETKSLLSPQIGYTNNVRYVTFSPDGKLLASSSLDGTTRIWGVSK